MRALRFSLRCSGPCLALVALGCGPETHTGTTHHVDLPDVPQGGTGGDGAGGSGGGGSGGIDTGPHEAPEVTDMSPLSGPYGTLIRITGTELGSPRREGVTLTLGASGERELSPDSLPEIVTWSEEQIQFRFPFPLEGPVVVTTPQGPVTAGTFTPTWDPGPPLAVPTGLQAIASLAGGVDRIAAVLDSGPPRFVEFDGSAWTTSPIADASLLPESIRLYLDETQTLRAFALSTAGVPEVVDLDAANEFAAVATGVTTAADHAVAGGPEGASIWYQDAAGWNRIAPESGVWTFDRGPFVDPKPAGAYHTVGATSDGTLYVVWAEHTGDLVDDTGAVFANGLAAAAQTFGGAIQASTDIDDYVTSIELRDRGSGNVITYCGSDIDPFGASATDLVCYGMTFGLGSGIYPRTLKETDGARYTFHAGSAGIAYCSPNAGIRLLPSIPRGETSASAFDAVAGEIAVWPCERIVAAEVDADGSMLVLIERQGQLYSPRPRAIP